MATVPVHHVEGGCHCRNIAVAIRLAQAPERYRPRVCDCDFCVRHGAAYLSDPHGSLAIRIHDEGAVGKYIQGSQLAEFVLCRNCGVLIGAVFRSEGQLYAAVNVSMVDVPSRFGERQIVSPKQLTATEKPQRWRSLWFPEVSVTGYGA